MSSNIANMFAATMPLWDIALRTLICYVGLLILLRIAGKREIGQFTPFDVVVLLMIGNAVQNAMVGTDSSVTGAMVAAAVLVGSDYLTALLGLRSHRFRGMVRGEPTLLLNDGRFIWPNLHREGVDPDEVIAAMREHGVDNLSDVKSAVLEVDGSISIVPRSSSLIRTRPLRHVRFIQRHD